MKQTNFFKSLFMLAVLLVVVIRTSAQEPYAVLSEDDTTLTFYYDDQKASRNGMEIGPFDINMPTLSSDQVDLFSVSVNSGWFGKHINNVVFDDSFANCTSITSTAGWFLLCTSLTSITGIQNLNTSNVKDMSYMFFGCFSLTSLDLSNFNTGKVTNMDGMFYFCYQLETIYVSNAWTIDNVLNGKYVFTGCAEIAGEKGTIFHPSFTDYTYAHVDEGANNPGYMSRVGSEPPSRPYAILSDDNTTLTFYCDKYKKSRSGMDIGPFEYNHGEIKSGWYNQREKIINVVFDDSFASCHSIPSTALWFYDCENLTAITGIQNLNTEYVTDMNRMFGNCYSLTALDLSGFVTDRVTDMSRMFQHCEALTSLNFSNFNTANVTDMQYMFDGCLSLTNLDVTKFNTEKVIDMSGTFSGLSSLSCLDLSNLNTTNVTRMKEMFGGCTSLTILDLSNFNTANVTDMSHMFRDCQNLETLNLSGFNTSNVTNMKYMFNNCPSLKTIYASDEWSNEKVTNSELMFYGCENIVGGAGTTYNLSKIDHTYAHIDGGAENPGYFTDKAASGIKYIVTNKHSNPNIYNLSGQRLATPQKGINIIDGKKVVMK